MVTSAAHNYSGIWDGRIGFGKKSALLAVDLMKGYVTEDAPLYAPGVVAALPYARKAVAAARAASIPLIYTNIRYQPERFADGGVWLKKAPVMKTMVEGHPHAELCDEIHPQPGELVISKQYPSAFFGTTLAPTLYSQGVDTVALIGCSTSGCNPGHRSGRASARLPGDCTPRSGRRSSSGSARGQSIRYRQQVRRRRAPCRLRGSFVDLIRRQRAATPRANKREGPLAP